MAARGKLSDDGNVSFETSKGVQGPCAARSSVQLSRLVHLRKAHQYQRPSCDSVSLTIKQADAQRGAESSQPTDAVIASMFAVVNSFDQMNLKEDLLRGLYNYGFEKPSAIQQRAVIPIVSGRDVIAQAQSGTGKTSMIAVTLCQMIDVNVRECAPASTCPQEPPPSSCSLLVGVV